MGMNIERVAELVAPVADRMGLHVYDIDQPGPTLRVLLDREGGVDIDTLAEATRDISEALDDADPIAGSYTLEVSSPGLERPLRRAEHFTAAIGEHVKVKLFPGAEGPRRADGTLTAAEGSTVTVETDDGPRTLEIADITKAHTVFEWATTPKKGKASKSAKATKKSPVPDTTTEPTTESSEDIR